MNTPHSSQNTRRLLVGLLLALSATAILLSVETYFLKVDRTPTFQKNSSETMMQTVSIADLRDEPLRSLWHLHIQPPAFDVIRAVLARVLWLDDSQALLARVDGGLYILWALLYGLTVFVIFWWLSDITGIAFAAVSSLLFSVHPALIFYATLLDATLLSAFFILCFSYLLWRLKEGRPVPVWVLAASFLTLYFSRSVFQWPWLVVVPLCLVLLRLPFRKVLLYFAITSLVVGLYTVKQLSLFGISSTSSFTGLNLCKSIGVGGAWKYYKRNPALTAEEAPSAAPRVLTRVHKVNGAINFNNSQYLEINRKLLLEYRRQLLASTPGQLLTAFLKNLSIYLEPSSRYSPHLIVDRIPWRKPYDAAASFPILPLVLLASFCLWAARTNLSAYPRAIGLSLPVICIALISVVFERGENMRFKFFIEPALFCFCASQAYLAGTELIRYVRARRGASGHP